MWTNQIAVFVATRIKLHVAYNIIVDVSLRSYTVSWYKSVDHASYPQASLNTHQLTKPLWSPGRTRYTISWLIPWQVTSRLCPLIPWWVLISTSQPHALTPGKSRDMPVDQALSAPSTSPLIPWQVFISTHLMCSIPLESLDMPQLIMHSDSKSQYACQVLIHKSTTPSTPL